MTEQRPQAIAQNMVKFGRAVFEVYKRTDRQTDILITILGEVINIY